MILQNYVVNHMESWFEYIGQNRDGPSRMGSPINIQCNKFLEVFDKTHLTFFFFKV